MLSKPSHEDALKVWSHVVGQIGEVCVLMLPQGDDAAAVVPFRPTEELDMQSSLEALAHMLLDAKIIVGECPWAGIVAPSFMRTQIGLEQPKHGQLQEDYANGDMTVREVVMTVVMEMDGPTTSMTFTQPLLEPVSDEAIVMDGAVCSALYNVLMHTRPDL